MRLRVLSDLHLESCDWTPPESPADVIILAGDIHNGTSGLKWARRHFGSLPVIYVPGNHEFFGGRMDQVLDELRAEARQGRIHVLDGDEVILGDVRFLGATLWTDFSLYGLAPAEIARAMADAESNMIDYQQILCAAGKRLRAEQSREIHIGQVEWLERQLQENFQGPTVVVTHFLPHRASIHPKYESDHSNPFFASDLDRLVRPPVSLWIHGHTHESINAVVNGTRVLCNPRGCPPLAANEAFDPRFVVDV
jgi:predicted phosphodiesterase